ncbi:hypothetical protein [Spiroplasma cantharicola]|uniref:Uncharacterized protein n=1 Tax=Spiroplasma cantharicola TaxID=362837 RepID=A0A0M4KEC7_9MOLU|nr:hypothetical protein [Spiroplasma cantharicola]ALD66307.1 hypothetical protein SCANT_v1c03970 [Spiroplasma cantharicola]
MINTFKPYKITSKDKENLKNLSPYWEKDVKKNIKKLLKWIIKFNKNPKDFNIEYTNDFEKYDILFQQIDNYSNFYNQKFKLINNNSRLLSKFHKLIVDYVFILGWVKSIELICVFFDDIQKKDIASKSLYAIELVNNCLISYFEVYKKQVINILKKDEYIDLISERIFSSKNTITKVDLIAREIMSYSKMLKKKSKISEDKLIKINILSIELIVFSNSILYFYTRFLRNVY